MTGMNDDRNTSRRLNAVALTGLWLVAAAVAVGVGFGAVRMVGDEVTDQIPAPLSAGRVAELSATPGAPASAAVSPLPRVTATTAPPRRGTTTPAQTRRAEVKTPTAPTHQATSTRTVRVTGGTVAVRCTGNSAGLLYARPDNGYASRVQSRGPAEVEVEFESGAGSGRVKARCSGGTASIEVRNR
jgi:hypothetical protein